MIFYITLSIGIFFIVVILTCEIFPFSPEATFSGPSKLFLLIKAPASFCLPVHFLPKRDFKYSKKVITHLTNDVGYLSIHLPLRVVLSFSELGRLI